MSITSNPKRVFVSVSPKNSYYPGAWMSPDAIVSQAIDLIQKNGLITPTEPPIPRILLQERWNRIHIVFDVFNNSYDPETAHLLGLNDLDVLEVYFSAQGGVDTKHTAIAKSGLQAEVNKQLREIHDWTGVGSQPPFIVDHSNGHVPTYSHPRTLAKKTKT
ncbi:hypothetical protein PG988_006559 [Apiospora saccharicola]